MGEGVGGEGERLNLHWTPSGRDAIALALEGVLRDGEVWISSSVGTEIRRLSPCVAQAVSRRARLADAPSKRTVGVVIVHEWGFPHPNRQSIVERARRHGWRIVDDCAHAFCHGLKLAAAGATVAFSLPKLFPITSGGILARGRLGKEGTEDDQYVGVGCRDSVSDRHPLVSLEDTLRQPRQDAEQFVDLVRARSATHVANWHRLDALAVRHGLVSADRLDSGVVPQAYRLRVARQFAARDILAGQGIETTPPFYVGWLALPCHSYLPPDYWDAVGSALDQLSRVA